MENQKKNATVALTRAALESAKNVVEMLEIPEIQRRWVVTQQRMFNMHESQATTRFETEKVLFMQTVTGNDKLAKCDRFSQYSAFMQLCASNLSLREGMSYLIPYKDKMTFRIGWKGRLEQLLEMPGVEEVYPPQVVYSTDVFEFERGMKGLQIVKHNDVFPRPIHAEIHYVYMVIERNGKSYAYMMNRDQVLHIRDQYADTYIQYMKHLNSDHNKALGKKIGDKVEVNGRYGMYEIDPPMWVSDEEQAFKKTLVHRVYNEMPNKLLRHYKLDDAVEKIAESIGVATSDDASGYYDEGDSFEYVDDVVDVDSDPSDHADDTVSDDDAADNETETETEVPEAETKKPKSKSKSTKKPEPKKDSGDDYSDGEAF